MQAKILISSFFAFLVMCCGLSGYAVLRDLRQTVEHATMAAQTTAQLMQANAERAIEAGDAFTLAIQSTVADWDMRDEVAGDRIWSQLVRQMAATPQVSSFWVVDASGRNLMENWGYPLRQPGRFVDRQYFTAHLAGERGLFIEPAAAGTVTGKRRFTLSRAVRDGDGRLRAVAVVGVYSETFAKLFSEAARDGAGSSALVNLRGEVLARAPDEEALHPEPVMRALLDGLEDSPVGTVRHGDTISVVRRLERLPLAVVAHVQADAVLQPWYRRTVLTLVLTGAALVAFGILVAIGLRLSRSEKHARRMLEAVNRDLDRRVRDRTVELERALRVAENADAAKGKFLATISHDLRQPLQGQAMFTELALQQLGDDKLRRLGEMTLASLAAGRRLLDDLVDLAQLESGVARATPGPVTLAPLLERLAAEARPAAERKGLTLRVVPTSAVVLSDAVRLQQIVQNLLGNAVKYTRQGKILLGCRRAGDALRIEVWDTGPGIPGEHLDMIFEEFYQVDNPARNSSEGVGLGLAIVDRTARLFGHPLGVRSTVGKGSVFSVSVPLAGLDRTLASAQPAVTADEEG